FPAVPMDHALNDRQSDSGSLELIGWMQALEHAEELVDVAHVETRALVADEHLRHVSFLAGAANLNLRLRAHMRKLDRIGDQVCDHQSQQGTVGETCGKRPDLPYDVPAARLGFELGDHLVDELIQTYDRFS